MCLTQPHVCEQGKPAAAIVEDKNAFTLFLSGAYRTNLAGDAKKEKKARCAPPPSPLPSPSASASPSPSPSPEL